MVGAGTFKANDMSYSFSSGIMGGNIQNTINVDNIPEHNHANGDFKLVKKASASPTMVKVLTPTGSENEISTEIKQYPYESDFSSLQSMGGSQPLTVMQPYIVQTVCQRVYNEYSEEAVDQK